LSRESLQKRLTPGIFAGIDLDEKSDTSMSLTDINHRKKSLKPTNTPDKRSDVDGLYLYLAPSGTKSWRFNYRYQGKQYTQTFDTYPLVSLN
jgi:hypothetical protein